MKNMMSNIALQWLRLNIDHPAPLVVTYGVSNTIVLEIP